MQKWLHDNHTRWQSSSIEMFQVKKLDNKTPDKWQIRQPTNQGVVVQLLRILRGRLSPAAALAALSADCSRPMYLQTYTLILGFFFLRYQGWYVHLCSISSHFLQPGVGRCTVLYIVHCEHCFSSLCFRRLGVIVNWLPYSTYLYLLRCKRAQQGNLLGYSTMPQSSLYSVCSRQ